MYQRPNKILASGGFKGGGKTYQTYKIIQDYIAPKDGARPRKVIIFDTNQECTNQSVIQSGFNFQIKTIKLSDLGTFNVHPKVECVRILPINPDGTLMSIAQKKETAWYIIQNFRGGCVILEDINSYILNVTQEEDFVGAIMNNAHRNADVIINFQSINMINPVLIRNLDTVRLHMQSDLPKKGKFEERWEIYTIAYLLVKEQYEKGNEKYCVHIENLKFKMIGNFTRYEFMGACVRYLNKFNPKSVKTHAQRLKNGGAKTEGLMDKAMAEAVKELFMYYGNPS